MTKLVIALVMLLSCSILPTPPALAAKPAPNPANYPLTVHVIGSRLAQSTFGNHAGYQKLTAIVDGRRVELSGNSFGVLALGDYKARIMKGSYTATAPNSYDTYVEYELLFPDGHTRPYVLTGLGIISPEEAEAP